MNRQVEANLSMVVSKALGGLNMNALKYLLPFVDSSCDRGYFPIGIWGRRFLAY